MGTLDSRKGLRRWIVLGVVAALAVASVSVAALAAGPRWAPAAVAGVPYGWQALGLTDEQIQKIAEIRQKAYEQSIPNQGELYTLRQQLALALWAAQPDAAKMKDLATRLNELQGQLQQIQLQAQLDILGVLTDEQRAKLNALALGGFGKRGFGPRGGFGYGMMGPGWRR
ncbi:MAG: periplasmic heavy metal sensor [Bacillota bacterium]